MLLAVVNVFFGRWLLLATTTDDEQIDDEVFEDSDVVKTWSEEYWLLEPDSLHWSMRGFDVAFKIRHRISLINNY